MPRSVVFAPPPGWPAPPANWLPPPGWSPPRDWPPAPDGWTFYLELPSPWVPHRVLVRSAHPSMRVHPGYQSRSTRLRSWRPPGWLREHAYIIVPGALLALLVVGIIGLGVLGGGSAADNSAAIRACTAELDATARDATASDASASDARRADGSGRVALATGRIAEVRAVSPNGQGVLHVTGIFSRGAQRWDFSCDARVSPPGAAVIALDMAPLAGTTAASGTS